MTSVYTNTVYNLWPRSSLLWMVAMLDMHVLLHYISSTMKRLMQRRFLRVPAIRLAFAAGSVRGSGAAGAGA